MRTSIILIALVVSLSIATVAFMGFLVVKNLESRIDAGIYSAENNIAVLNENGVFDIFLKNYANRTRAICIVIGAGEHVSYNETVTIEPLSFMNVNIIQRLDVLGTWTIELYEDKEVVGGYSFATELNEAEAEMRITQLDNMRFQNTQLIITTLLAILGAIGGIPQIIHWIKPKPHLKITIARIEKIPNEDKIKLHLEIENEAKWWRRNSDAAYVVAEWYVMDKNHEQWGSASNVVLSPFLSPGTKLSRDFQILHQFRQEGNPHSIIVRISCEKGGHTKKTITYFAEGLITTK